MSSRPHPQQQAAASSNESSMKELTTYEACEMQLSNVSSTTKKLPKADDQHYGTIVYVGAYNDVPVDSPKKSKHATATVIRPEASPTGVMDSVLTAPYLDKNALLKLQTASLASSRGDKSGPAASGVVYGSDDSNHYEEEHHSMIMDEEAVRMHREAMGW